jgi:murein DD-endopeptidase MepM/ murein hydrolase activator NlpD
LVPVFFLACFLAEAQGAAELPRIDRLSVQDVVFRQYLDDVEMGRRLVYARYPERGAQEIVRELTIYSYLPAPGDELFLISARCNIYYDAIATLNRWGAVPTLSPSVPVLLPSMPGIFIPEEAQSDLERLIFSSRGEDAGAAITVAGAAGKGQKFRFIPGDSFSPNERFFFVYPGVFRFPLNSYRLTSPFGMRVSPISGRRSMHGGLDLAAPEGTEVYAARDGVVSVASTSAVYGRYVVISHGDNWTSLYGHLSALAVRLHDRVKSGTLIGRVGSTGQSTGPHLHFELRQNGKAQDPKKLLRAKNE